VNQNGVEEVVTDKGYHSGAVLSKIAEWGYPKIPWESIDLEQFTSGRPGSP
jgi:hypothetical protein